MRNQTRVPANHNITKHGPLPAGTQTPTAASKMPRRLPDRPRYGILGVGFGASENEIKTAYRRLALQLHPDKNPKADPAQVRSSMNKGHLIF
jgi:hypothetical protein